MPDFGRKTEAQAIRDRLPQCHDGKFGLTVFRVVYGNDEEWSQYLARLTAHAKAGLSRDAHGPEIEDELDWNVQDNGAELKDADRSEIRRRFKEWVASVNGFKGNSRYAYCIYASEESIRSVLNGDEPGSRAINDRLRPSAFVEVIDEQYREVPEQLEEDEVSDDERRRRLNEGDEGYAPIDGNKRQDVGWMKVAARALIPRAYQLLMDNHWPGNYRRPPQMLVD